MARALAVKDGTKFNFDTKSFADRIFTGAAYILILAFATLAAWYFNNLYIAVGVYTAAFVLNCLFASSLIGTLPIFAFASLSYAEKLTYDLTSFVPLIIVMGGMLLAFLVFAIVFLIKNKVSLKPGIPMLGFVLMVVMSATGGLLIGYYKTNLQMYLAGIGLNLAILVFAYFFSVVVRVHNPKFIARTLIVMSFIVLAETLIYFMRLDELEYSVKDAIRSKSLTYGWGISNDGAIMMLAGLPACFYLIANKNCNPCFYLFLSALLCLGIILTQSRTTMIVMAIIFLICALTAFIKTPRKKEYVQGVLMCLVLLCVIYIAFHDVIKVLYETLKMRGTNDSGRLTLWKAAISDVSNGESIFGMGFMHQFPGSSFYVAHSTGLQIWNNFGFVGVGAGLVYYFLLYKTLLYKTSVFGFFMFLSVALFDLFGTIDLSLFAPYCVLPTLICMVAASNSRINAAKDKRRRQLEKFLADVDASIAETKKAKSEALEIKLQQEMSKNISDEVADDNIPKINLF